MRFSACLEMLFVPEAADFSSRVGMAKAAGFDLVEFWRWTNKDLDAVETALRTHDIRLSGMVAEPMIPLTDPTRHADFLLGLEDSIAVAQRLGAPLLIAQAGNEIDNLTRAEQHDAVVTVLRRAAPLLERANLVLALEPLNTLVDHPGYYLHSTTEGLDIVDAVGSRHVRVLYDIYHSAVMGENIASVLAGRLDRIAHVHLADAPGRNEPGSGDMDWQGKLDWLTRAGYRGPVGLEFRPTGSTVAALERVLSC